MVPQNLLTSEPLNLYSLKSTETTAHASAIATRAGHVFSTILVVTTFGLLTTKDVEFVDEVYHAVRVDAVGPRVGTLVGTDAAANAALFAKDVIELDRKRSSLAFEEGMRDLSIPKHLVGVHLCR